MSKNMKVTSKTRLKTIRVPHEILNLVNNENNVSAALINLMIEGAKARHGEDFSAKHQA